MAGGKTEDDAGGDFGATIRSLRKEKGYSQTQLAAALGVSSLSITRWENQGVVPHGARGILLAIRALPEPEERRFARPGTPVGRQQVCKKKGGK